MQVPKYAVLIKCDNVARTEFVNSDMEKLWNWLFKVYNCKYKKNDVTYY